MKKMDTAENPQNISAKKQPKKKCCMFSAGNLSSQLNL